MNVHMSHEVSGKIFAFHRLPLPTPFPETSDLNEVFLDPVTVPQVFLDGAPVAGDGGVAFDLPDIPAAAIRGMSVMRAFTSAVIRGTPIVQRGVPS